MAHYVKDIDVPGSPEATFEYLAHFDNVAEWDPGIVEARKLSKGPLAVGSEFRVVASFLGQRTELVYRITAIDPPKRVVLEADSSVLRSVDTIHFEPERGGTRIRYHARLELKGWRRWFDAPLQLAFAWIANDAVRGLQRKLGRLEA